MQIIKHGVFNTNIHQALFLHALHIFTAKYVNAHFKTPSLHFPGYITEVFWIGLNDFEVEGRWVWTESNKEPEYSSWAETAPNNGGNDENCGIMNPLGQWNDIPCSAHIDYICEKPAKLDGNSSFVVDNVSSIVNMVFFFYHRT